MVPAAACRSTETHSSRRATESFQASKPPTFFRGDPLTRDGFEAVLCRNESQGFCLPAHVGRIRPARQQISLLVSFASRLLQRHRRIVAEVEHVCLAGETITEAPRTCACWADLKAEAVHIGNSLDLRPRLHSADANIGECGHVSNANHREGVRRTVLTSLLTCWTGCTRTAMDVYIQKSLRLQWLTVIAWTTADALGWVSNARSGTRTHIPFRMRDFKSLASTGFAIRAERKKGALRWQVRLGMRWRPRSESNRRTRICSPLHDHSATRPSLAQAKSIRVALKKQNLGGPRFCKNLERETRLELATPTLARSCSTN